MMQSRVRRKIKIRKFCNTHWRHILLGIILTFFFVVLLINAREVITLRSIKSLTEKEIAKTRRSVVLMSMGIKNSVEEELLRARQRTPDVYREILSVLFKATVVVISSKTSGLSLLERMTSRAVRYLRSIFGMSRDLELEGTAFVSITLTTFHLAHMVITCYPLDLENRKYSLLLLPIIVCSASSFIILNLLGKYITWISLLRTVLAIVCFAIIALGIFHYFSINSTKSSIIKDRKDFDTITNELFGILGKDRRFESIYLIHSVTPPAAFAAGIFFRNLYVTLWGLMALSRKQLFGVILHEAGHCYHIHVMIELFLLTFQFFLLLIIGGWFVSKDKAFGRLDAYNASPSNGKRKKLPQVSVAMRLALFSLIIVPAFVLASNFALNLLQRYHEFQADFFSAKIGYTKELIAVLRGDFVSSNRSNSWLYSTLYETHPCELDRIDGIERVLGGMAKIVGLDENLELGELQEA